MRSRVVKHEVSEFVFLYRKLLPILWRAQTTDLGLPPNQGTLHCPAFPTTVTRGLKVGKARVLSIRLKSVPDMRLISRSRPSVFSASAEATATP
jgi:hypothetical protein